jgi:hypothetical protein
MQVVGFANTVQKYREEKPVVQHTTPFPMRVDREVENEQRALVLRSSGVV